MFLFAVIALCSLAVQGAAVPWWHSGADSLRQCVPGLSPARGLNPALSQDAHGRHFPDTQRTGFEMCETEFNKIRYHIMDPPWTPLAKFYVVLSLQSAEPRNLSVLSVLPSGSVCTTGMQGSFSDLVLCFVAKTEFSRCNITAQLPFLLPLHKVCPNCLCCECWPGSFLVIANPQRSLTSAIHLV